MAKIKATKKARHLERDLSEGDFELVDEREIPKETDPAEHTRRFANPRSLYTPLKYLGERGEIRISLTTDPKKDTYTSKIYINTKK